MFNNCSLLFLVFVLNRQLHAEQSRDKMLKHFFETKVAEILRCAVTFCIVLYLPEAFFPGEALSVEDPVFKVDILDFFGAEI